jgi:hypothetical protein
MKETTIKLNIASMLHENIFETAQKVQEQKLMSFNNVEEFIIVCLESGLKNIQNDLDGIYPTQSEINERQKLLRELFPKFAFMKNVKMAFKEFEAYADDDGLINIMDRITHWQNKISVGKDGWEYWVDERAAYFDIANRDYYDLLCQDGSEYDISKSRDLQEFDDEGFDQGIFNEEEDDE